MEEKKIKKKRLKTDGIRCILPNGKLNWLTAEVLDLKTQWTAEISCTNHA